MFCKISSFILFFLNVLFCRQLQYGQSITKIDGEEMIFYLTFFFSLFFLDILTNNFVVAKIRFDLIRL